MHFVTRDNWRLKLIIGLLSPCTAFFPTHADVRFIPARFRLYWITFDDSPRWLLFWDFSVSDSRETQGEKCYGNSINQIALYRAQNYPTKRSFTRTGEEWGKRASDLHLKSFSHPRNLQLIRRKKLLASQAWLTAPPWRLPQFAFPISPPSISKLTRCLPLFRCFIADEAIKIQWVVGSACTLPRL